MGNKTSYGAAIISGFLSAFLSKYIPSDYALVIGGAVGSAVAVTAGRFLHLSPTPKSE